MRDFMIKGAIPCGDGLYVVEFTNGKETIRYTSRNADAIERFYYNDIWKENMPLEEEWAGYSWYQAQEALLQLLD